MRGGEPARARRRPCTACVAVFPSGEMGKGRLDDFGGLDTSDDTHSPGAVRTALDVDAKDAFEPVHPAQRGTGRRGVTFGAVSLCGDDVVTVLEVRGEHAVVSGEMGAGAWNRASSLRERHFRSGEAGDAQSAGLPICTAGGCPEGVRHPDVPHEFDGVEHDMSGAVTEGVVESIHDLCVVIDREAFVGDCGSGDIAAQAFEGVALMDSASGADPRLHHSGGLWRENPES